jgi:hypothetical protein
MIDNEMLDRIALGNASISEGFDSVIPLALEVKRLREVIERCADSQALPTTAEVRAHRAAGGSWMVVSPSGEQTYRFAASVGVRSVRGYLRRLTRVLGYGVAYVALGRDGLPCAWPVAATEGGV